MNIVSTFAPFAFLFATSLVIVKSVDLGVEIFRGLKGQMVFQNSPEPFIGITKPFVCCLILPKNIILVHVNIKRGDIC